MTHADRLLDLIEEGIVAHGGDLGGWTRRDEDRLQLFDGRVTLHAEFNDEDQPADNAAHAHVLATLHEYDDEVLDACLMGMGEDRDRALAQAAGIWIAGVAGPIKSFLDNKPICMTCQVGVEGGDASQGDSPGDYGLPGLRAYVGPSFARGIESDDVQAALDHTKPWFRYAAESAAPRRVHLAKSIVLSNGRAGWSRELEIDGHDVSHRDPDWPAGIEGPEFLYLTRYAVFEFPHNSTVISERAELERAIRHFARNYSAHESVDQLMEAMIGQGFNVDMVHEVESISTIAFGRAYFEPHGVQYSPTVLRARRDGRIETNVPLMSLPAYSRARALAPSLRDALSQDDYQALCFYNAESHAILQAWQSSNGDIDLSKVTMFPCIVPDRDTSEETMNAAMATLQAMIDEKRAARRKPWWKFW